jgi:RNA recognition motif-containing protein
MEIFIGNLAENVTLRDLTAFFKTFANKAHIRLIEKRQENGTRIRYGIADFDSDKLALKAIKKFNGAVLRGQKVALREFFRRSYSNERRALNWRDKPWDGPERRKDERRKKAQSRPADSYNVLVTEATEHEKKG